MQGFMNSLAPGYFDTMGIALLEGRDFESKDQQEKAAVAIVNRRFAEHYFGEKSAVGRHIGFGSAPGTKLDIEIVGVVANTLYEGPREGLRRQVYVPINGNRGVAFYVRAAMGSQAVYGSVRGVVKSLDASLPIYELKTLGDQLDQTLLSERLVALLSASFGLLATLLAAVGLYGVMAFVVARRTKELGIRIALGAQPGQVLWLVMREVLVLFAIGLAVGVPAAFALAQYVATQLYGVKPHDPSLAVASVMILALVSAAAGFIPAQRASRIDPIGALRFE
jgi:predicted permease